jgi:hypothetical protein
VLTDLRQCVPRTLQNDSTDRISVWIFLVCGIQNSLSACSQLLPIPLLGSFGSKPRNHIERYQRRHLGRCGGHFDRPLQRSNRLLTAVEADNDVVAAGWLPRGRYHNDGPVRVRGKVLADRAGHAGLEPARTSATDHDHGRVAASVEEFVGRLPLNNE